MKRKEEEEEEERGVGGKLRKPNQRKHVGTPYDRPPPPPPRPETESQTRRKEDGGGWWFSKFVDPAARIISGGATRLLPSFFSKPPVALTASDAEQPERKHDDVGDWSEQISNIQMLGTDESQKVPEEPGIQKTVFYTNLQAGDKLNTSSAGTSLSEIERMVKDKIFSREDLHRLTELLHSRMVHQPDAKDYGNEIPSLQKEEAATGPSHQKNSKASFIGKQADTEPILSPLPCTTSLNEIGASPVEIAKSYMGTQVSELGFSSRGIVERGERTPLPTSVSADGFLPKSSIYTPQPKPSPCWPGAMIHDQHANMTPQTERGRVRLHNLPRTPYSRTIFSRSTSKLQGSGDQFINVSSIRWKQSQPSLYGDSQAIDSRTSLDNDFGSVGPIRRVNHKFAGTRTPLRGPDTFYSFRGGQFPAESPESLLPMTKQKDERRLSTVSNTNIHLRSSKAPSFNVGVSAVHPQSSEIAMKILEHLDRTIPTPQKKLDELKLATSWRRTSSSEFTTISPNAPIIESCLEGPKCQQSTDKLFSQDNEVTANTLPGPKVPPEQSKTDEAIAANSITSTSNATSSMNRSGFDGRPFVNFKKTPSQVNSHEVSVSLRSLQNEKNQDTSSSIFGKSIGSKQTFGNKVALADISVTKPGTKHTVSLDNGSGFSFPVSAPFGALSEPPTPTILPAFSSGSLAQLQEKITVPSYTFGSKKPGQSLVFSFPSTSLSAPIDTSTPHFTFGSRDKARISFRSVGKDAICY